jgi:N-acetyl-anhydromuramyl-L-alanine amidase AmpD
MTSHRLYVLHIQEGTETGTDAWFHNSASQVSSHLGNPKQGEMDQWVDTKDRAWAEADYNSVGVSTENEGQSGDTLTPSQLENNAQALAWAHTTHGTKLQVTNNPDGEGVIGHGQLGVGGGNHPDCPGAPILAQRQAIVDRALVILGQNPPSPTPQSGHPAYPGYIILYTPGVEPRYDHNVKVWQQRMRDRGWVISVDGYYGPKSETVCMAFQKDSTMHHWYLQLDGELGPETWRAAWERPISS